MRKTSFSAVTFFAAHAALLLALRPNPCTLVRALSTLPPVARVKSARLCRACRSFTALAVVSAPAASSARYRAQDNKTYVLTADDFAGVSFTHGHWFQPKSSCIIGKHLLK